MRTKTLEMKISRSSLAVEDCSTNHRFGLNIDHDSSMRTSRPVRDARAPNQSCGLACADQGQPRAALDANDLWICHVRAQHPVESYGYLARRCHLGHTFRLLMTAMQILLAQSGIVSRFSAYPGLTSGANVCRRYSGWSAVDSVCASQEEFGTRDTSGSGVRRMGASVRYRPVSQAVTLLVSSQIARSTLCLWQRCLRRK